MASGCNDDKVSNSTDQKQAKQTEQALSEAQRQVGFPAIINYQELKNFKLILEARDQENLITYTYLVNEMNGKIGQFLGKSYGYGIPAATQFTNPNKIVDDPYRYQSGGKVMPQPDPNGLYMPTSTTATWVFLLDPNGTPRASYIEPLIIVSPFPLHNTKK